MGSLDRKIRQRQIELKQAGLLRQRSIKTPLTIEGGAINYNGYFESDGRQYLNFSSNDYLGLSHCDELKLALTEGAERYGVGSGSSPLITGYSQAHVALEQALCQVTGHQAALLFSSGFSANTALMKTLFDKEDVVVTDKLIHASIIDGIVASGAKLKRYLHNSVDSAANILSDRVAAVVTESLFSMDGDCAPLTELSLLCKKQGCYLIVDDAHGFGLSTHNINFHKLSDTKGLSPRVSANIADIQIVTFGKALGGQGAAILASTEVINFLVANGREYIYSTALSPCQASATLAAVNLIQSGAAVGLIETLTQNITQFKALCKDKKIPLTMSVSPIQPIIIGDHELALAITNQLAEWGIWVGAIRPPTVPKGKARLRVTITASHSAAQILELVNGLDSCLPSHLRGETILECEESDGAR